MLRSLIRRVAIVPAAVLTVRVCASAAACKDAHAEQRRLFSLEGRVALVTGGSKGLGKAIARGLALAGADVVISSRNADELNAALREVTEGTTVRGTAIVSDLSQPGAATALGQEVLARHGRCDIFVNNAGISKPGRVHTGREQTIAPITDTAWDDTLAVNLSAGVHLLNVLAPGMVSRGWGRVIHISSIGGLGSSEGRTSYSATKSALLGVTNAAALELGPHGITVNCVCPGPFLTDMPLKMLPPSVRDSVGAKVPLKRWGQPEEMVGPVLMLSSNAGSYVNGAVLRVDGGLLSRAY